MVEDIIKVWITPTALNLPDDKLDDIAVGRIENVRAELLRFKTAVHIKIVGFAPSRITTFPSIEEAQRHFNELKKKYNLKRP